MYFRDNYLYVAIFSKYGLAYFFSSFFDHGIFSWTRNLST